MNLQELHKIIMEGEGEEVSLHPSTREVYGKKQEEIGWYPDPELPQRFSLNFSSARREWANVLVTDASGTIVIRKEKQVKPGLNEIRVDLSKLAAGTYKVTLLNHKGVQSKSFVLE